VDINGKMINDQQIQEWKTKFKKIFKTIIDGEPYIWRKLGRPEYVTLMADRAEEGQEALKLYERQEEITAIVTLYPENIKELIKENAGLATAISTQCLDKSGFDVQEAEEL
jgi:hypothetical protein